MGLVIESGFDTRKFPTLSCRINGAPAFAPSGKYSHRDWSALAYAHGYEPFGVDLQASIRLSLLDSGYSVSYSSANKAYTVSHSSVPFTLAFASAPEFLLMRILGFTGSQSVAALSHTSDTLPMFVLESAFDCPIWYKLDYEGADNLGGGNENGMIWSTAPQSIPKRADLRIGYIPREDLYRHLATAAKPWCWEDFINHHRSGELFFVDGSSWYGVHTAHRLRADGMDFKPVQISPGYQAEQHLNLQTYIFR